MSVFFPMSKNFNHSGVCGIIIGVMYVLID